jgi:Uma2 family endonuclease
MDISFLEVKAMGTIRLPPVPTEVIYPDSDGRPIAETSRHFQNLSYLVMELGSFFAQEERVYIAGNMFLYYVQGDRHRHVSPDVFVVRGIPKKVTPERRRYLVWEEGKGPDVVIELTSRSTEEEDIDEMRLYQDSLRVREYYLFDPYAEYLQPPIQGYRLQQGAYVPIAPLAGRLPSEVLGLHLESAGEMLRLYNPATGQWLPTPEEVEQAWHSAEEARAQEKSARKQAEKARRQAEKARAQEEAARRQAEVEVQRLQRELQELRRRLADQEPDAK